MNINMHRRVCFTIVVILLTMMSIVACATVHAKNTLNPDATPTNKKHLMRTQKFLETGDNSSTYPYPNPDPNQVKNTATPFDTESPYPYPYVGPVQPENTATLVISPTPTYVPQKTEIIYQEVGIMWQECSITYPIWDVAQACLGLMLPDWSEEDRQRLGEQKDGIGPIRQTIGNDVYETTDTDKHNRMETEYVLLKNNEVITTITGTQWAYDPNQSLIDVGGKIAWEFADHEHPTVIYDGKDVRGEYNVEAAYRPYDVGEKLLFVAQKDGKYFVVYDGQKLGPEFELIQIAYCCEPAMYSIRRLQGQYWFWGSRNGQNYIVVITAIQ
jgi:plastocyanin